MRTQQAQIEFYREAITKLFEDGDRDQSGAYGCVWLNPHRGLWVLAEIEHISSRRPSRSKARQWRSEMGGNWERAEAVGGPMPKRELVWMPYFSRDLSVRIVPGAAVGKKGHRFNRVPRHMTAAQLLEAGGIASE